MISRLLVDTDQAWLALRPEVVVAPPSVQGGRHWVPSPGPPQPRQQTDMHAQPAGQLAEEVQLLVPAQAMSPPQKHPPSVVVEHRQMGPPSICPHSEDAGGQPVEKHAVQGAVQATYRCPKAGDRRLVRTGAVHAIAAPAPMRLSILRREISLPMRSSSMPLPPCSPSCRQSGRSLAGGHAT
jgi:hypothetical protein